jgi:hypothetical protein
MNVTFKGTGRNLTDPNICPHCHVTNTPHNRYHEVTVDGMNNDVVISIWICSNRSCQKSFVCLHKWNGAAYNFVRFLNGLPKGPDWPQPIIELKDGKTISDEKKEDSRFILTYLQSLEAENYGLNELAGMGYRKAVEYLVKDWAIQNNPDKKEEIQKAWLGGVIKDYYEGDLKEILERATWLGNDQSHYIKLFEEFDLEVLKELIGLIMTELDSKYKKAHYIDMIKKRK